MANLTEKQKEKIIQKGTKAFEKFMDVMFPQWKDDVNLNETPQRFTKALVNDIASGLYSPFPKITVFDNVDNYKGIVLQKEIPVKSLCAHHLQNIYGKASVAYIPNEKIIGLSKLNRIVEYYSRRPQVQENLTQQIHDSVNKICEGNSGVAVIITASHMCVSHRGIGHDSKMSTATLSGAFMNDERVRNEFYKLLEAK